MERVSFITIESGDDLIVSFAIQASEDGEVKSLTLLRTPKHEFILDDAERGVSVSFEEFPQDEDDLLQEIELSEMFIRIRTNHRDYELDVQAVDDEELKEAKRILKKMNFDDRFELKIS